VSRVLRNGASVPAATSSNTTRQTIHAARDMAGVIVCKPVVAVEVFPVNPLDRLCRDAAASVRCRRENDFDAAAECGHRV